MFDETLKKISEPIDIGVLLILFPIGAIVQENHLIQVSNTSSLSFAAVFSIGGLGIKKVLEAILSIRYFEIHRRINRVNIIRKWLSEESTKQLNNAISMLRAKVLSIEDFDKNFAEVMLKSRADWYEVSIIDYSAERENLKYELEEEKRKFKEFKEMDEDRRKSWSELYGKMRNLRDSLTEMFKQLGGEERWIDPPGWNRYFINNSPSTLTPEEIRSRLKDILSDHW
jgi:hypothetical protein